MNAQDKQIIKVYASLPTEQLDSLLSRYPASALIKAAKLYQSYHADGTINPSLWQSLLHSWPIKSQLLQWQSAGFMLDNSSENDHSTQTMGHPNISVTDNCELQAKTSSSIAEINSSITQKPNMEDIFDWKHISFIYTYDLDVTPIKDQINTDTNTTTGDSDFPTLEENMAMYWPHISFIYTWPEENITTIPSIQDISNRKSLEKKPEIINEAKLPLTEILLQNKTEEKIPENTNDTLSKYGHSPKQTDEIDPDPPYANFILWLKSLNPILPTAPVQPEMKNKKKSKKTDLDGKSKAAKKLIKKNKELDKKLKSKNKKKQKDPKRKELERIISASIQESPEILSETYADLLANQGYIDKAIQMYEQLSLLFPEKSISFAAKISTLKNN